jgi:hypothetical protein
MVELWIRDVKLVGIDADYGTILIVERADFPEILASEQDLVVEFIPRFVSNR